MRKLFALLAAAAPLLAQERVELPRYTLEVPAGWKHQAHGDGWVLQPADGTGEVGIAPMNPPVELGPASTRADARALFWATAKRGRTILEEAATQEDKDPSGRTWSLDIAAIQVEQVSYMLVLGVVELAGRAEGFLVLGTPEAIEKHQKAIDAALWSVRPRPATPAAEKAPAAGQPSPLGTPGEGRLAGVWTATTHELRQQVGGVATQAVVSELVLFADGAALWGMPGEGLLGFDREAHRARSPERWSTYALEGDRVRIGREGKERVYARLEGDVLEHRYQEGGSERRGERFLPRPSPDGAKLEGELRREGHWTTSVGGCVFSRDGTFVDQQLLWVVLPERAGESKEARAARVAPGKGRYRLEHWTLVLEYADGRVNRVGFVPTDRERPGKGALLNGFPVGPRPDPR